VWTYFGAVWVFVLLAFLLGVLLAWVFWVRPLRKQLDARPAPSTRSPAEQPHAPPVDGVPGEQPREPAAAYELAGPDEDVGLGILADREVDAVPPEPVREVEHPWNWAFTEAGWQRESVEQASPEGAPFGPGSAEPSEDGSAPSAEFTVKARTSSMVFHTSDSPFYENLMPQVWFTDAETATRAGFTDWERPQAWGTARSGEDGDSPR
jgi:hypothetical protein